MEQLAIFTDGSTLNNQTKGDRKGGVGVFFGIDDARNISLPLEETDNNKVTNQVTELLACIKAIEKIISSEIINNKNITIYTDSNYTVNIVTKWGINWEKNNWKKSDGKTVDNLELVKKLYYYSNNLNIKYIHVRSHTKEPKKDDPKYFTWYGNHMADQLAVNAAKSIN